MQRGRGLSYIHVYGYRRRDVSAILRFRIMANRTRRAGTGGSGDIFSLDPEPHSGRMRPDEGLKELYGEAFDGKPTGSSGNGETIPEKSSPHKTLPDQDEPAVAKGLCVNCAIRQSCGHQRPNGGVWHCEDYC